MTTDYNLRQKRARLLREIAHYAASLAVNPEPVQPAKRNAHTRAARCLQARSKMLASLGWPKQKDEK